MKHQPFKPAQSFCRPHFGYPQTQPPHLGHTLASTPSFAKGRAARQPCPLPPKHALLSGKPPRMPEPMPTPFHQQSAQQAQHKPQRAQHQPHLQRQPNQQRPPAQQYQQRPPAPQYHQLPPKNQLHHAEPEDRQHLAHQPNQPHPQQPFHWLNSQQLANCSLNSTGGSDGSGGSDPLSRSHGSSSSSLLSSSHSSGSQVPFAKDDRRSLQPQAKANVVFHEQR